MVVVKNPPANAGEIRDVSLIPGPGRPPGEENGNPLHPGWRCLVGYRQWDHKESYATEPPHFFYRFWSGG